MKTGAFPAPFVLFLVFSLLVGGAAGQERSKQRGIKVKTAERAVFTGHVYDDLWAVVIGINDYEHWEDLSYAVNDARAVKDLLIRKFGFRRDHVIELLDAEATLVNIRTMLGGVLPQKTKKGDGLFVFFAGHGETVDLPDGGNLGYLVPFDGSTDRNEYFATLLPMTQIREICSLISAKHIFFAVDACYSGLAAVSERGMSDQTRQYIGKLAALKCRVILTAGGRGEPVIENDEWGHSAFTLKFLEGLESGAADFDGDGVITSGEIATYIKTRVPKLSENRQTPQFKNLTNDEGEFVFLLPTSTRPAEDVVSRDASEGGPDDAEALKRELERLKQENEKLKQQSKDTETKHETEKKKESRRNDAIPPPP
ncbi:MAG: caspase family protein [Bacteroidota bacterium]|nr:caspase family protein [Bacteroidota bacterium]